MAFVDPHLDPRESLGYQVRLCHRRFDRLLAASLAPYGIKGGFWYYLRVLWQRDGVTQKHLSDEINVAENTTVATLAAMERDGLILRTRDAHDRRKVCVTLTAVARDTEPELIPLARRINDIATAGIDPADLATCLRVLESASNNLAIAFDRKGRIDPASTAQGKPG